MKRPYLRVTPSEDPVIPGDIPERVASLSKLTRTTSTSLLHRLNPFHRPSPPRFEFVALSVGEDEPVEFYYGADDHLDALEQRLRSIYPPTYDIDRVEVDLVKRLVRPVEYSRKEFAERLKDGRLYHEMEQSAGGRAAVADGGEVTAASDASGAETELPERTDSSEELDVILDGIDLVGPRTVDDDEPLTVLDGPAETDDGTILARPSLAEVKPYGVEWWGAAPRRKDWMTTLTGFTEVMNQGRRTADGITNQSRLPLTPLVKQIAEANQPLAFQVVFRSRSDWSRDARRRAGELLDGTDTLLQKFLSLESPGSRRRSSNHRNVQGETRHASRRSTRRRTRSSTGDGPSRPTNVEGASRFDQIRQNSPKRTFSVNLQLLTLAIEGDEPEDLAATLDPLRSVFDLVDGQFYEIDGRRLRSKGFLPGSGRRHARAVLNRFTSRSMATGGRRLSITNRSETRPDLVLNGNELSNFIVIPPSSETPERDPSYEVADARGPDGESVDKSELEKTAADPDPGTGQSGKPRGKSLSSAPNSVMHRDAEIHQMTGVLEPLASGSLADTILVTGPTGSGKTHTVKYTVDRLCQQNPGLNAVYVNCWEDHSAFQTLYRILDHLEGTLDIHRKSTPRDVLLERLKEHDDEPSVVILDEVDQLDDKDLLYDLINLPRFSLLLIVNQEKDLLDGLDDRLASRLGGCERIPFGPYNVNQLVDILREIAKREPVTRNLDQAELELVADAVNGDARVAKTALRIAARRAEELPVERITEDIVESALPEARQEVRRKSIDMLSPHQRVTFRVIEEHGKIAPGELIEEYRERVDDPKSNRTIRNYLNKLERYDLVEAEGTTRDRMYRCLSHR